VINLESPLKHAFDGDLEFILLVQQILESRLSDIYYSNDRLWISIGMKDAGYLHEIRNSIIRLQPRDAVSEKEKNLIEVVVQNLLDRKIFDHDRIDLKQALYSQITRIIERDKNQSPTFREFMKRIHIMFGPGTMVPKDFYESVEAILRVLIDNSQKRNSFKDKIVLRLHNRADDKVTLCIDINYADGYQFGRSLLDVAFSAPFNSGSRDKIGLFLIGSIARAWGGWAYLQRDDHLTARQARIELPVSMSLAQTFISTNLEETTDERAK
jgi:hypothetical protein